MKRRVALKSLAFAVAGAVFLPGCDLSSKASSETIHTFLSPSQDKLLADLAETLIPETNTPGAKALKVHDYIKVMVADCHEPEAQKVFFTGLETVEKRSEKEFGKAFAALEGPQKMQILKKIESSDTKEEKEFYHLLKGLTIQGYMTSEYVMTSHLGYELVPGFYNGCVPVSSLSKA